MISLKNYFYVFIIAFTPLSSFADCISRFPEKYDFSGEYTGRSRKLTLETENNRYECYALTKKEMKRRTNKLIDKMNVICSEDLSLYIEDADKGNMTVNTQLVFKNKTYGASALPSKSNPNTWFETKVDCLEDRMIESFLVEFKLIEYDKTFKYKQDTVFTIATSNSNSSIENQSEPNTNSVSVDSNNQVLPGNNNESTSSSEDGIEELEQDLKELGNMFKRLF